MTPKRGGLPQQPPATADVTQKVPVQHSTGSGPAAELVQNFIRAAGGFGPAAEEDQESALKNLRKQAADVVVEIARAERGLPSHDYPSRWMLVFAAAQLEHPAALPFLRGLVTTPIPAEQSQHSHGWSIVAEETILRTTAVEGIARLAQRRTANALATLLEFLSIPSFSIRRAAAHAILSAPGGTRLRRKISELLPAEQRFILDLKQVDVRDVPQVKDPRKHLPERALARERKAKPSPEAAKSRRGRVKRPPRPRKEKK